MGLAKVIIVSIFLLILIAIGGRIFLIMDSHKKGENLYEIEVNRYGRTSESHFTKNYRFDKNHCVVFVDELGLEKTICGDVNITKY